MIEAARPASSDDLSRIAELARDAIAELRSTKGGEVWAWREARKEPIDGSLAADIADADAIVLVGTIDDAVIGYAVAVIEQLVDGNASLGSPTCTSNPRPVASAWGSCSSTPSSRGLPSDAAWGSTRWRCPATAKRRTSSSRSASWLERSSCIGRCREARGVRRGRRRGGRPLVAHPPGPRARSGRVVSSRRARRGGRADGRGRGARAGRGDGAGGRVRRAHRMGRAAGGGPSLRDPRLRRHAARSRGAAGGRRRRGEAAWVPLHDVAEMQLVEGLAEFLHDHQIIETIV